MTAALMMRTVHSSFEDDDNDDDVNMNTSNYIYKIWWANAGQNANLELAEQEICDLTDEKYHNS